MSREQRRADRKRQAKAAAQQRRPGAPPPSRRTPVKARGGGGFNWMPFAIVGGTTIVVVLIAYLVLQIGSDGLSASDKAERDADPSLPGAFFASQGRGHFSDIYAPGRANTPFCDGVEHADASASAGASPTPGPSGTAAAATSTPVPTATRTPAASPTSAATAAPGTATPTLPPTDCYQSNPPSSGRHLGVQTQVDLGGGITLGRIPPDPNVYPPDVEIPRDAIPHILEHSGVFLGYHCAEGDAACQTVVDEITDIVNDRIDNHDDRVVMGPDSDLPLGQIGISSWTRADRFDYQDFERDRVIDFIDTHSCRFDPEGFC
jgi:hypothetical protein